MAGTMMTFPSNGSETKGYLSLPPSGSGPGLLVIQEWWGLVQHIKNMADRYAARGSSHSRLIFTKAKPQLSQSTR